jgi:hypothetical protein
MIAALGVAWGLSRRDAPSVEVMGLGVELRRWKSELGEEEGNGEAGAEGNGCSRCSFPIVTDERARVQWYAESGGGG